MLFINNSTLCIGRTLLNASALGLSLMTCSAAIAVENSAAKEHKPVRVAAKSDPSLYIVTFKTDMGQIRVTLPSDMRPGDAIVGSTSLEPSGHSDADKDVN